MQVIRTLIALSVALTFPSTSAYAADLTGAKCKKAGQVRTLIHSKYKCIKEGKKLTWRKIIVPTQLAYATLSKEEAEVYNLIDQQI